MVSPAIRALRGRLAGLGLGQHDLADVLEICQSTLNHILTGRRPAPEGFAARANRALDYLERVELAAAEARSQAVAEMGGAARNAAGDDPIDVETLPEVLFLEELARLLRCSRATLERRVKARVFPVPPIQGVDSRPRWSKLAVMQWLALGGPSDAPVRQRQRRTA
ncbi:MAG: hypothetical protein OXF93_18525 [Acidobacteria bacterium]|nr:hypothetical protein [Acidobacteriota bacterium]